MSGRLFPLLLALAASLFPFPGCQPSRNLSAAEEEALLRGWIRTLGSDEFGGRKPMTEYEGVTVDYLAAQMEEIGLRPAFGDSWFQQVKMISTVSKPAGGSFRVRGRKQETLTPPEDLVVWTARPEQRVAIPDAEFVFCGFGIDAPEYGWNDFAGVDVRGKVVIAMVNDPGYYDPSLFRGRNMTYYGRWTYKLEQAERLGAAGCLVLHNTEAASYGWHVCVNSHIGANLALYDEQTGNAGTLGLKGWIHEDGCRKLFDAAGLDFDAAVAGAKRPGFKAVPLKVRGDLSLDVDCEIQESRNVGGVLPGTDLADEAVVFNGHWDHFGFGQPDETGDPIYNGAADNASGLAAVLLLARKYAALPTPTRRSLLFLCVTSEESGMFGSQHYCAHPAFPMDKTAACINFDIVAPFPLTHDVVVLGGGESRLDDYLSACAAEQGRHVVFDDDNSDGWFFRSDHFRFWQQGVPAVVVENGTELADPSRPNKYPQSDWYHKPSDEYREDWDLSGTVANLDMMYNVGLLVANADKSPRF